ncbi:hypothetical protein DFP72DRAFT_778892, partial [Ephemerocybe angulata]
MATIATAHHDSLQRSGEDEVSTAESKARMDEALAILRPRISPRMATKMSEPVSDDEVRAALKQVPNNKAPGLDGIPVEVWKKLDHEFTKAPINADTTPFNVIGALREVVNDIEVNGITPGTGFAD